MKKEFLKLMKCPYCGTDFEIKEIYEKNEGEIIHGSVKCECGEYPILEGILNLKLNPLTKYTLELLKKGKIKRALMLLLEENIEGIWAITDFLRSKHMYGRLLRKVLLDLVVIWAKLHTKKYFMNESFYDLLGNNPHQLYFKHRFSSETLWSVYLFIPLLKTNKRRILDLCCGMGHASFIISTYVKPKKLVCADHAFKNLYLAKKYFVENAQFICLDANYTLPFKDDIFDSVFMLDALHYILARAQLAKELRRVLYSQGLLLLLHLHNSHIYNVAAGYPLTPQAWLNLFKDKKFEITAIPEKRIVENFLLGNLLDLEEKYSENELNSSNAISIIGTKNKSLLRVLNNLVDDFLKDKSNLIINPVYKIDQSGNKIILKKNRLNKLSRKEYPLSEVYLPEKYIIDESIQMFLKGRFLDIRPSELSGEDLEQIESLMRRFIVLNVPDRYLQ